MFTMKKIIPLVLLCVFLVSGCKEKGSAVKSGKKEFSVTGCKVDLDSYFVVDLYKTKDCAEKIMELDKNMHLTIAEVSEFGEELRVVNSDKSINGWVHTSAVLLDKEVLFRCLKSLLKSKFNPVKCPDLNCTKTFCKLQTRICLIYLNLGQNTKV